MKQLEVQIMGQSYLLGCPEGGEQRMLEAVEKVDGAMCRIRDAGKVKARDRIAVLAQKKVLINDTLAAVAATDDAWIREYFHGPRGRAAADAAQASGCEPESTPEQT
jgi:cell division protein ZapA (FtsZ GTPase activity inhibitor)